MHSIFPSAPSIAIAREKLNSRRQSKFEFVIEHYSDLSLLALKCEYGKLQDNLIRDQLILGVRHSIKEKLTLEQPKSLQSAFETARRIEIIKGELNACFHLKTHLLNTLSTNYAHHHPSLIHKFKRIYSPDNRTPGGLTGITTNLTVDPLSLRMPITTDVTYTNTWLVTASVQRSEKHITSVRKSAISPFSEFFTFRSIEVTAAKCNSSWAFVNAKLRFAIDTGSCATVPPKRLFIKHFALSDLQKCTQSLIFRVQN